MNREIEMISCSKFSILRFGPALEGVGGDRVKIQNRERERKTGKLALSYLPFQMLR